MKKAFVSIALLAFASVCCSQKKPFTQEELLLKSKHQKRAATGCMVAGVAMTATGILLATKEEGDLNSLSSQITGIAIAGAGIVCIVTSMALYGASSKNKKKAAALVFKNEKSVQFLNGSMSASYFPALGFRLHL